MKYRLPQAPIGLLGGSKPCTPRLRHASSRRFTSIIRSPTPSEPVQGVAATEAPTSTVRSPKWLGDIKARIGKCITFGLDRQQAGKAGEILQVLGRDWRELLAGREGFLVDRKRAGLLRHKVVWGEQDCMSHVNNTTYVRWAESARVNWAYNHAIYIDPEHKDKWSELWSPRGDGLILRSMRTDYKFPMTWPDHISVFHKLRNLPSLNDSHFILDVMIISELHQRPAARCVEDIVVYDYPKGRKTAIRPFMMNAFQNTWQEQEMESRRAEQKISTIEREVRELETSSWNRPGAKEDMGSAE